MSMPPQLVNEVNRRRNDLRQELTQIEKQIYDLETTYLNETRDFGNVFSGWNNYLGYDKTTRKRNITNDERLFSLSSVSSPAARANNTTSSSSSSSKSKR